MGIRETCIIILCMIHKSTNNCMACVLQESFPLLDLRLKRSVSLAIQSQPRVDAYTLLPTGILPGSMKPLLSSWGPCLSQGYFILNLQYSPRRVGALYHQQRSSAASPTVPRKLEHGLHMALATSKHDLKFCFLLCSKTFSIVLE